MTYEEKLDITVEAIREARSFTRKDHLTKLYLGTGNGLTRIPLDMLYDILLQLQDDEKVIKVGTNLTSNGRETQKVEISSGRKNYFLVNILDTFDSWYEKYRSQQKAKPKNFDWINLLKMLDVCSDINEKLQIAKGTVVLIPSFPYPYNGRFLDLFPFDTVGTRKNYQQYRWESAQYLLMQGIVLEVEPKMNDVLDYGNIQIKVDLLKFEDFYKIIRDEYEKRIKSKSTVTETKIEKAQELKAPVSLSYDEHKGVLDIDGKVVNLNKASFRAKILELLLKNDKNRRKEWSWDEVVGKIQGTDDPDILKENKNKFYPACDGVSKFIALKIGVNDLLIYNKSTVLINPKYL